MVSHDMLFFRSVRGSTFGFGDTSWVIAIETNTGQIKIYQVYIIIDAKLQPETEARKRERERILLDS